MCEYYYDEDRAVAYKIEPVKAAVVQNKKKYDDKSILVHTDVKVTNFKKEKVRRTLSKVYPSDEYDLDTAKKAFVDTTLFQLIASARKISEEEYEEIKARVEVLG